MKKNKTIVVLIILIALAIIAAAIVMINGKLSFNQDSFHYYKCENETLYKNGDQWFVTFSDASENGYWSTTALDDTQSAAVLEALNGISKGSDAKLSQGEKIYDVAELDLSSLGITAPEATSVSQEDLAVMDKAFGDSWAEYTTAVDNAQAALGVAPERNDTIFKSYIYNALVNKLEKIPGSISVYQVYEDHVTFEIKLGKAKSFVNVNFYGSIGTSENDTIIWN